MRKIALIIALVFFVNLQSQTTTPTPSLPKKLLRISTPKMAIDKEDSNILLLKMEFNGAIPKSRLSSIKLETIQSISLIYSRYKLSEMFDQLTLNSQRMDKLYNAIPGLKDNRNIQWYWVEQTGCENPEACGDYFHGFVITLKSEESTLKRTTELDLLSYYTSMYEGSTDTKKMDSLIVARKLPMKKLCDTSISRTFNTRNKMARIKGWNEDNSSKLFKYLNEELGDSGIYHLHLILNDKSKFEFLEEEDPIGKPAKVLKVLNNELKLTCARYKNKKIGTYVILNIDLNKVKNKITFIQTPLLPDGIAFHLDEFLYAESKTIHCEYMDSTAGKTTGLISYSGKTPDLIFRVFDRNKQWQNCLIATDVTGSMYPYLAQFQLWHKLHLMANSGNHDFVFFNDGDMTPDHIKITGSVGGIYYVNADSYEALNETMLTSMQNGGGGDCPENNIEAVLEGLRKNPSCKEVIMIADNWATPRDLSLLEKVKVPIRLVLCGAQYGINTAYLDMIRKNKGSIHTIEKDLYNLATMMDGQSIDIDGQHFILKDGKFILQKGVVVQMAN